MNQRLTLSEKVFTIFVYVIMFFVAVVALVPFLNVITLSLSSPETASRFGVHLFPTELYFGAYKKVIESSAIYTGFLNSALITVVGTVCTLVISALAAYPLSKKYLIHRGFWTGIIVFTMFFAGGTIPNYILIRNLGLMDSHAALILPGLVNTFNMLIIRNFFMGLPEDIEEAARIDGANDFRILFQIVIPLSKSILATVALWTAVGHWNSWFPCLLYIRDADKYVLQVILRRIILDGSSEFVNLEVSGMSQPTTESVKAATTIVTILPIMLVYPFLQKYFVKGVMVGSLKG